MHGYDTMLKGVCDNIKHNNENAPNCHTCILIHIIVCFVCIYWQNLNMKHFLFNLFNKTLTKTQACLKNITLLHENATITEPSHQGFYFPLIHVIYCVTVFIKFSAVLNFVYKYILINL